MSICFIVSLVQSTLLYHEKLTGKTRERFAGKQWDLKGVYIKKLFKKRKTLCQRAFATQEYKKLFEQLRYS